MIDGEIVIDAVVHGFDTSMANRPDHLPIEIYSALRQFIWDFTAGQCESEEPGFFRTEEEFYSRISAEAMANVLFAESDTDIAFYHHVQVNGYFREGVSRLETAIELSKIAPNRAYFYGGVDTFAEDRQRVFAEMEELAEAGAVGFKFYPTNGAVDEKTGALVTMLYDNPEIAFPFFEKARELGVTHLGFHKAFPVGPGLDGVRVSDMVAAAVAFPDMTFEIVHSGWAFLEETALELFTCPNIYANIEYVGSLLLRRPRRFAEIIGSLIQLGGYERVLFGSGAVAIHPDPILRAFQDFQMPEDLQEGYEFAELTPSIKQAILGKNMARLHGIDLEKTRKLIANDEWAQRRAAGKQEPWTLARPEAVSQNREAVLS